MILDAMVSDVTEPILFFGCIYFRFMIVTRNMVSNFSRNYSTYSRQVVSKSCKENKLPYTIHALSRIHSADTQLHRCAKSSQMFLDNH